MKKLIATLSFILLSVNLIAQNFNIGLKNPKDAYNLLDNNGKSLMQECSRIAGVPIDSMMGVDSVYNTFKYVADEYNVKVIVVSDHQINNYTQNPNTTYFSGNTIVEDFYGKNLETPMFMVFIRKTKEGTEITLQMYY